MQKQHATSLKGSLIPAAAEEIRAASQGTQLLNAAVTASIPITFNAFP